MSEGISDTRPRKFGLLKLAARHWDWYRQKTDVLFSPSWNLATPFAQRIDIAKRQFIVLLDPKASPCYPCLKIWCWKSYSLSPCPMTWRWLRYPCHSVQWLSVDRATLCYFVWRFKGKSKTRSLTLFWDLLWQVINQILLGMLPDTN